MPTIAITILPVHLSVTLVIHAQMVHYIKTFLCTTHTSDVSSLWAKFCNPEFGDLPRIRELYRGTHVTSSRP